MIGLCRRAVHLAAGELLELCKSLICEVPLHAYFLTEIGFEMTCFVYQASKLSPCPFRSESALTLSQPVKA